MLKAIVYGVGLLLGIIIFALVAIGKKMEDDDK